MTRERRISRQGKYKVGTCKITFTAPNEDKLRVVRRANRLGYKDYSAYLRTLVHEAVWQEPLLPEDMKELERMTRQQENA